MEMVRKGTRAVVGAHNLKCNRLLKQAQSAIRRLEAEMMRAGDVVVIEESLGAVGRRNREELVAEMRAYAGHDDPTASHIAAMDVPSGSLLIVIHHADGTVSSNVVSRDPRTLDS
jgi:DNA helicase TIP49 (TBP-interacting protein)